MSDVSSLSPLVSMAVAWTLLVGGAYLAAVLGIALRPSLPDVSRTSPFLEPLRTAAALLTQQPSITERPDMLLWLIAPASYAALAGVALTVVPLDEALAIADVQTGIVLFGAAEALAIVAVFLRGWSPNSHFALQGGFRFVAVGLSYELLSMFVLIAAALPAESLQVSAIVEAQAGLWNVIRQPLGLPLWVLVTLGVTFTGPFDLAEGSDLTGGVSIESSGRDLLLWQAARGGMLAVFSAMGAAVFLGGWFGPWLPGWIWMGLKTLALMTLTTWVGQRAARLPVQRTVTLLWTIGLPAGFAHLLVAGLEALR